MKWLARDHKKYISSINVQTAKPKAHCLAYPIFVIAVNTVDLIVWCPNNYRLQYPFKSEAVMYLMFLSRWFIGRLGYSELRYSLLKKETNNSFKAFWRVICFPA